MGDVERVTFGRVTGPYLRKCLLCGHQDGSCRCCTTQGNSAKAIRGLNVQNQAAIVMNLLMKVGLTSPILEVLFRYRLVET